MFALRRVASQVFARRATVAAAAAGATMFMAQQTVRNRSNTGAGGHDLSDTRGLACCTQQVARADAETDALWSEIAGSLEVRHGCTHYL